MVIGDSDYVKFMKYGEKYLAFEFILSFVYLVAHVSHIEASNAQLPFLQVITYQSQRLVTSLSTNSGHNARNFCNFGVSAFVQVTKQTE